MVLVCRGESSSTYHVVLIVTIGLKYAALHKIGVKPAGVGMVTVVGAGTIVYTIDVLTG